MLHIQAWSAGFKRAAGHLIFVQLVLEASHSLCMSWKEVCQLAQLLEALLLIYIRLEMPRREQSLVLAQQSTWRPQVLSRF